MIKCARIEIFLTKPMFGRALEATTQRLGWNVAGQCSAPGRGHRTGYEPSVLKARSTPFRD